MQIVIAAIGVVTVCVLVYLAWVLLREEDER